MTPYLTSASRNPSGGIPGQSSISVDPSVDPSVVLRVAMVFLIGVGIGLTVMTGSPLPIGCAFAAIAVAVICYAVKFRQFGTPIWKAFAEQAQLNYLPVDLLSSDREKIFGDYRGRQITLSQIYPSESTTDRGYVVLTVALQTSVEGFCVDDSAYESCSARSARRIQENPFLSEGLSNSRVIRICVFEQTLSLHALRIPQDHSDFRLLCELIVDLAEFLD